MLASADVVGLIAGEMMRLKCSDVPKIHYLRGTIGSLLQSKYSVV